MVDKNLENLINKVGFNIESAELQNEIDSLFLDSVEIKPNSRDWVFKFKANKVLNVDFLINFENQIKQSFYQQNINSEIFFSYEDNVEIGIIDYENFWPYVAKLTSKNIANLSDMIIDSRFARVENDVQITFNRSYTFEFFSNLKKSVDEQFAKIGLGKFKIRFALDDETSNGFENQFEEFNLSKIKESVISTASSSNTPQIDIPILESIGKQIAPTANFVPLNQVKEDDRVVIEGMVFASDSRDITSKKTKKTSTLGNFKVTDFNDSIDIKKFSRNDAEAKFLKNISPNDWVRVSGSLSTDDWSHELTLNADGIEKIANPENHKIETDSKKQRIELHTHTINTAMSGMDSADKYFKRAKDWNQSAIAITDNASVQSYHDVSLASQKTGVKAIYGYEANFVQENQLIAINPSSIELADKTYVTFDIETTGLSAIYDKVIELSAVKMKNGEVIEEFQEFIDPGFPLSQQTISLTNITDEMVKDSKTVEQVFDEFRDFYGDAILVGHNVNFDLGFMNHGYAEQGKPIIKNPVIDTLTLARALHPEFSRFTLDFIAGKLGVELEQHHRAIFDSIATGKVVEKLLETAVENFGFTRHEQLNDLIAKSQAWRQVRPYNLTLLVQNDEGLKNLFEIVSESSVKYFFRKARVPRSLLDRYRKGILVGSGDLDSEFFDRLLLKGYEAAKDLVSYYDYLEVQPLENYQPLVDNGTVENFDRIKELIKQIYEISKETRKPLVVTGDTKFLDEREAIYREILTTSKIARQASGREARYRSDDLYYRRTDELLEQFSKFLGDAAAQEIVVDNTHLIASMIDDDVHAFKKGLSAPKIEGSEQKIRDIAYSKAHEMYGGDLPQIIIDRLEKELNAIINNGFSVIYLIFQKLVAKSNKDGYLVGSRGSVGSSLVATMLNITEVNPLPPHYRSKNGDYVEFIDDANIASGFDLPEKKSPIDDSVLIGDGQNIPFETFMGFDGTKVPDIDLNFSGDYQPIAHNYTKALFGENHVYRAGTISTIAERTAIGLVKSFEEAREVRYRNAEELRLATGITGVKRTTGQHAGGVIIVPQDKEVTDFTPVQYPSDDQSKGWLTTHFDYHSIDENLLKMDMLGHDDPTILRMLQDITGIDPKTVPMNDPNVLSLFTSPKALKVTEDQILSKTGTYGVPEMGTNFVRGMLTQTQPKKFGDLLQISGLSHGTGVYIGNADELIRSGQATISSIIGTRDQIMSDLIGYGLDPNDAFQIMEKVRKGKGVSEEHEQLMREKNVPQWYIDSSQKIQYMFPRSHATAYVMSALRIAYFKVYFPSAYYAAYMTVRSSDITFGAEAMTKGSAEMLAKVKELRAEPRLEKPQQIELAVYEIANEAWQRGLEFKIVDLQKSDATDWIIEGKTIILPFIAIKGLGESVAKNIVAARSEHDFISKEDLQQRTGVNTTLLAEMSRLGILNDMSDENQISLFG